MEDLVVKDENAELGTVTKKSKLKEDEDDDIDTEKTMEKTYKEVEKSLTNVEFIEGVNEVGHALILKILYKNFNFL